MSKARSGFGRLVQWLWPGENWDWEQKVTPDIPRKKCVREWDRDQKAKKVKLYTLEHEGGVDFNQKARIILTLTK